MRHTQLYPSVLQTCLLRLQCCHHYWYVIILHVTIVIRAVYCVSCSTVRFAMQALMEGAVSLPGLAVQRKQPQNIAPAPYKRARTSASRNLSTAEESFPANNSNSNPDPIHASQLGEVDDDAELLAAEAMALLSAQEPRAEASQPAAATALPAAGSLINVCNKSGHVLDLQKRCLSDL